MIRKWCTSWEPSTINHQHPQCRQDHMDMAYLNNTTEYTFDLYFLSYHVYLVLEHVAHSFSLFFTFSHFFSLFLTFSHFFSLFVALEAAPSRLRVSFALFLISSSLGPSSPSYTLLPTTILPIPSNEYISPTTQCVWDRYFDPLLDPDDPDHPVQLLFK